MGISSYITETTHIQQFIVCHFDELPSKKRRHSNNVLNLNQFDAVKVSMNELLKQQSNM